MLDATDLKMVGDYVLRLPAIKYRPTKVDMSVCWLYSHHRPIGLADILERLIRLTGWNKTTLAHRMGTTPQTISRIMNGNQTGLTKALKRNLEDICAPFPELYETVQGMNIPGPGRPPTVERIRF